MEVTHESRRHTWRRGLGLLAAFALLVPLFSFSPAAVGAQTERLPWEGLDDVGNGNGAPIGAGFEITNSDMTFMLEQLRNMDLHLDALEAGGEPCEGIFGTDPSQVPTGDPTQPIGIRVLDGSCNNLVSAINNTTPDTERWGASDEPFERLFDPAYDGDYGTGMNPTFGSSNCGPIGPCVIDATPRHASNLINDQTDDNPAALAAGGVSLDPPEFGIDGAGAPDPSRELLSIENVAPDGGLSAPFNDMLTFFGQFFDHGLDLTTKAGETVMMPLSPDDPLYVMGSPTNFMAITRAQTGVDDPLNKTTPYVDQNQTYSSHPSHQVFLREYGSYANDVLPVTGRLLNPLNGAGAPSGEAGMATWDDLQENAELNLGFLLDDILIDNVPMMLTNPYGRFIPGPDRGLPQLVVDDGLGGFDLIEGDRTAPVDIAAEDFVETGHGFSIDISHHAVPGTVSASGPPPAPGTCNVGDMKTPDIGVYDSGTLRYADDHDPCTYDDEMLGHHYQSGDGRVNENIALTAVHHIFHSEHNRLQEQIADKVTALPAELAAEQAEWIAGGGEYLFQAAKLITEMEYQHLAFEEFARSISPVAVFDAYQTGINSAIVSEFANSTYRFGHSMLNDNVRRYTPLGVSSDLSLVEAFLNPPAFVDVNGAAVSPEEGAGALWRGGVTQVGQEVDEFVVDALRNRLVGIPLDLAAINIARGRDNGIPTLNGARADIAGLAPYVSWTDFRTGGLKTPESAVNFIAAYGTHPSITAIDLQAGGTFDQRRAAADLLVNGGAGAPGDRVDFMNAAGAWAGDTGGLDDVDLWNGGLAEKREFDSGALLGVTHDVIFRGQMEALQEGDRFYYLHRLGGTNLLTSLEGNSLSEIAERNTTAANLPANVFSRPDFFFDLTKQTQTAVPPAAIVDDSATNYNEPDLIARNAQGGPAVEFGPQTVQIPGVAGDEHTNWFGSEFNDVIDSGDGDDTLRGNDGDDYIQGDGGGDNIIGGAGDDILIDSSGEDDIKGGPGNDAIDGGPDIDLLQGNDGDDLFRMSGNGAAEVLAGPGDDLVAPRATATGGVLGAGDDWAEGGNGGDAFSGDDDNPLHLTLLGGNDVLTGDDGPDRLEGEGGEDIFRATGPADGLDRYFGLFGFDWLVDSPASDLGAIGVVQPIEEDRFQETEGLSGTDGDDVLIGNGIVAPSIDPLTLVPRQRLDVATSSVGGIDTVVVDTDGVTAPFFEDGNIILGGPGSDRVTGMGENDILHGDAKLDVYLWHVPSGTPYDSVAEFQDAAFLLPNLADGSPNPDRMNPGDFDIVREIVAGAAGTDVDVAVYQGPIADYDVTMIDPYTYRVEHARGDGGTGLATDDGIDIVHDFETLEFLNGDTMDITAPAPTCNGLAITIFWGPGAVATNAADVILGTPGADVINGLAGADTICGEGGADVINGGGGVDTIFGGDGDDIIGGQGGADILHGEGDDDRINGGVGNDQMFGGPGADDLRGQGNADTMDGGDGVDQFFGGSGNDIITTGDGGNLGTGLVVNGGGNNDTITGSPQDDDLRGQAGLDELFGLGGNDLLRGGLGADDVFGGDGDDTLTGDASNDHLSGGIGTDDCNGGSGTDTSDTCETETNIP